LFRVLFSGLLGEWDELILDHPPLSPEDRALAAQLASSNRLIAEELAQGLRLRFRSWAGLIRFSRFDLRIVPKLADGYARLIQMLALTGGLAPAWPIRALLTHRPDSAPDLLDLLSTLLARECERILAGGLLHDYLEQEDALPAVRGRFLAARQWTRRSGQFHLLECRFDDPSCDLDENRLLAFALKACRPLVRAPELRRRIAALHDQFAALSPGPVCPAGLRGRLVYHRLNAHYAVAHELCWLILGAMGVSDLLAPGRLRSSAFLIGMNLLFERFIGQWLEFCLRGVCRIQSQSRRRSILWDLQRHLPYSSVIPDLLPSRSGGAIAAGAKDKPRPKLGNADIDQCFLDAQAFPSGCGTSLACLITPSASGCVEHTQLEVRNIRAQARARLDIIALPVAAAVDELMEDRPGPVAARLAGILAPAC
jgi:5-methylcytosine-specific restriction enzyme subunit McrC